MPSETVWVKSRGRLGSGSDVHIHTDPDCQVLARANAVKETTRAHLPADWPDCALCAGTRDNIGGVPPGENTNARRNRLQTTDPDELAL